MLILLTTALTLLFCLSTKRHIRVCKGVLQDGLWLWSGDMRQIPGSLVKSPAHIVTVQVAFLLKPFIHNTAFFCFHNGVTYGFLISCSVSVKPMVQSPALSLLISQKALSENTYFNILHHLWMLRLLFPQQSEHSLWQLCTEAAVTQHRWISVWLCPVKVRFWNQISVIQHQGFTWRDFKYKRRVRLAEVICHSRHKTIYPTWSWQTGWPWRWLKPPTIPPTTKSHTDNTVHQCIV